MKGVYDTWKIVCQTLFGHYILMFYFEYEEYELYQKISGLIERRGF